MTNLIFMLAFTFVALCVPRFIPAINRLPRCILGILVICGIAFFGQTIGDWFILYDEGAEVPLISGNDFGFAALIALLVAWLIERRLDSMTIDAVFSALLCGLAAWLMALDAGGITVSLTSALPTLVSLLLLTIVLFLIFCVGVGLLGLIGRGMTGIWTYTALFAFGLIESFPWFMDRSISVDHAMYTAVILAASFGAGFVFHEKKATATGR